MIFLVGIGGFIGGFFLGQMILAHMLRDKSKEEVLEMMKDSGQKFKYGGIGWLCAMIGAVSAVFLYNLYFSGM